MHFRLVRALVRHGAVAEPVLPEYVQAMVGGLALDFPAGAGSVLDELRADPGLLEHELWALLTTERTGRALTYHDGFQLRPQHWGTGDPPPPRPDRTWQHALTTLAAEGAVDRGRLLDATLGAFLRDWAAADIGWFVGLHDALAPTDDELATRQGTYARLQAVEHGPVVKVGLRAMTALHHSARLDVSLLLSSAPAALARPDKGTVLATLALLGSVAATHPDQVDPIADVVAAALLHERADVQERALALLTTLLPGPARRQELLDRYADNAAPIPPDAAPVSAHTSAARAPGPLPPARDADEVGELFTRLIEEADDPAEIERLLDGVLRHASERPRHGADVLALRAEQFLADSFLDAWSAEDVRADLAALALVWLRGVSPGRGYLGRDHRWDSFFGAVCTLVSPPRLGPGSSLGELVTAPAPRGRPRRPGRGRVVALVPDSRATDPCPPVS